MSLQVIISLFFPYLIICPIHYSNHRLLHPFSIHLLIMHHMIFFPSYKSRHIHLYMLCTNPNLHIFQFMSLVHIHPFQYKLYPNPYSHIFQCMPKIHIHICSNLRPKSIFRHVPFYTQFHIYIYSNACLNSYYPTRHMPPNPYSYISKFMPKFRSIFSNTNYAPNYIFSNRSQFRMFAFFSVRPSLEGSLAI